MEEQWKEEKKKGNPAGWIALSVLVLLLIGGSVTALAVQLADRVQVLDEAIRQQVFGEQQPMDEAELQQEVQDSYYEIAELINMDDYEGAIAAIEALEPRDYLKIRDKIIDSFVVIVKYNKVRSIEDLDEELFEKYRRIWDLGLAVSIPVSDPRYSAMVCLEKELTLEQYLEFEPAVRLTYDGFYYEFWDILCKMDEFNIPWDHLDEMRSISDSIGDLAALDYSEIGLDQDNPWVSQWFDIFYGFHSSIQDMTDAIERQDEIFYKNALNRYNTTADQYGSWCDAFDAVYEEGQGIIDGLPELP